MTALAEATALRDLRKLVRRRFPTADRIVYGRADDDMILWQVRAGDTLLWDSIPDDVVIPDWERLPDAVGLLSAAVRDSPERGDMLTLVIAREEQS